MPPAVVEAMAQAAQSFVDVDDLNARAGETIARLTGAEAGLVTAGSAAGMLLEAAACMAGTDPAKVNRLPDTKGMKNEIIIHRAHRVTYDRSFRGAGATLVEIGNTHSTHEWELEDAITDNTAAVAYVFGPPPGGALPLPRVVEIAHSRDVPVIVDAAAMLPPPENLTRYLNMGADMVSFSGGKGILGPQSTGVLCGRSDLIEAAVANGAPNQGVGRVAKVCKEEIAGLVTALEIFVDTDHDAKYAHWETVSEDLAAKIDSIPGLTSKYIPAIPELDAFESATARVFIFRDQEYSGPNESEIESQLKDGAHPIYVFGADHSNGIALSPVCLVDGDDDIIVQRLREIMSHPS